MDNTADIKHWDEVIDDLNREENADRRYRRYNNSYDAIGENLIQRLSTRFSYDLNDLAGTDQEAVDFYNNIEND